jgi:hypothetical protein
MKKIRPLRIFKLGKEPYIIFNKQKIPLKSLSKEELIKLNIIKNKKKIKKTQKKILKIPEIEQKVQKRLKKIVAKRPYRKPHEKLSKKNKEEVNRLLQINYELTRKKHELEQELLHSKLEKDKVELDKIKKEKEEIENAINSVVPSVNANRNIRDLPAPRQQPIEEEKKNEIAIRGKYANMFNQWINDNSGKKSFDDLQNIGIIPENLRYGEQSKSKNAVKKYGWTKFLISQGVSPNEVRTNEGVSLQRRKWIGQNAQMISNRIAEQPREGNGKAILPEDENKGLYDYEIDEFFEGMPNWYGAISKEDLHDLLKKLIDKKPNYFYFIYLIENYQEGKTNHWVAIFFDDVFDNSLCYYDSYGKDAPPDLHKKLDLLLEGMQVEDMIKWKYNTMKQQGYTTNCGIFTINYIMERLLGHDHKDASKYDDREADIARFFLK